MILHDKNGKVVAISDPPETRNFDRMDLRSAHLAGLELEGISLDGADLSGVNCRGADLYAAFLSDAKCDSGDLRGDSNAAQLLLLI